MKFYGSWKYVNHRGLEKFTLILFLHNIWHSENDVQLLGTPCHAPPVKSPPLLICDKVSHWQPNANLKKTCNENGTESCGIVGIMVAFKQRHANRQFPHKENPSLPVIATMTLKGFVAKTNFLVVQWHMCQRSALQDGEGEQQRWAAGDDFFVGFSFHFSFCKMKTLIMKSCFNLNSIRISSSMKAL